MDIEDCVELLNILSQKIKETNGNLFFCALNEMKECSNAIDTIIEYIDEIE